MEAVARGSVPEGVAHEVLRKQSQLLSWEIAAQRVRMALSAAAGLAIVVALSGAGYAAWKASRADGLVVEPFSVPPMLAERGITGAAVASEVLDQLSRLNVESRAFDPVQVSDSWTGDSRVEIPQTGVSIDEVNRLLRRWLGNQTFVSGSVALKGERIELAARPAQGNLVRAVGSAEDIAAVARPLAEQLLAQVRPTHYGRLLIQRGQLDEAIARFNAVLRTSISSQERAAAHAGIGQVYLMLERRGEAAAEFAEAVRLGSDTPALNLGYANRGMGRHREAVQASAMAVRKARPGPPGSPQAGYRNGALGFQALLSGDYLAAEQYSRSSLSSVRSVTGGIENHILPLIGLHETSRARREIGLIGANVGADGLPSKRAASFRAALSAHAAAEDHDWPGLLGALDAAPVLLQGGHLESPPAYWRALALAHLGRAAEAQPLVATPPTDCYRCWILKAQVAEAAGDQRGADAAFATAVRLAPDAPFARTDHAAALLARGRPDEAIAKAKAAHRNAPRFADPLAYWGEALLAKGDADTAAARFAEAAALAPRWGRVHLKWGEALAKTGKAAEAQAHWRTAAGLDLTPAERAELEQLRGGARG